MSVPAPVLVLSGFILGVLLMRPIVSRWIRRMVARQQPFRAIADAAPAMLRVADTDGRCTYLNRGWLDFTGGRPEEESASGWSDAVHPDDRGRVREISERSVAGASSFAIDTGCAVATANTDGSSIPGAVARRARPGRRLRRFCRRRVRPPARGGHAVRARRPPDRGAGRGTPRHRARAARRRQPASGAPVSRDRAPRAPTRSRQRPR